MTQDRKSTRLNSSHSQISYAVFCLKKKKRKSLMTSPRVPGARSAHGAPPAYRSGTSPPAAASGGLSPPTTRASCPCRFFFNDTATTEIYTLSLHDALPIFGRSRNAKCSIPDCSLAEENRDSYVV